MLLRMRRVAGAVAARHRRLTAAAAVLRALRARHRAARALAAAALVLLRV